jgi:oxygen-independent coproporphyrinogen-3 oxidase
MDHFALPGDDLAVAQRQGRLHRNFQGYSTHADSDLIAFGISAIGRVGPTYYQNTKTLDEYYDAIDWGHLPVKRGIALTQDDLVRRAVIQALICHFKLSVESIELAYLIEFKSYFEREIAELKPLMAEGLVDVSDEWLTITPRGRLLVRAICMVFDRYLADKLRTASYSKVI